jgi:protocatechuate 3,4-dioxygenase alpha subunit
MTPEPTPSQTIGPFFHDALLERDLTGLVQSDHPQAVEIRGAVYDGTGEPVPDAMLEVWQADSFGRSGTDTDGSYSFVLVKPGPLPGPGGTRQAPHVNVSVFARGLLKRLITRIYFPDEQEANAEDPLLASIQDPALRQTLIARQDGDTLHFDIHLQGKNETAFFEFEG